MKLLCRGCDSRNVTLVSRSEGPLIKLELTCNEAGCGQVELKELRPNVDLQQMPRGGVSELKQY